MIEGNIIGYFGEMKGNSFISFNNSTKQVVDGASVAVIVWAAILIDLSYGIAAK